MKQLFICLSIPVALMVLGCGSSNDMDDGSVNDISVGNGSNDAEAGNGSDDSEADNGSDDAEADNGSDDSEADSGSDDGSVDVAFEVTSSDFETNGIIPSVHHVDGGNISPALSWRNAPEGTKSFGVLFRDVTIDFDHSAIWNIPANVTELPRDVEQAPEPENVPGAVQCRNWFYDFGYGGPGSESNTYEFIVYALSEEKLVGIDQETEISEVKSTLEKYAVGTASISGQTAGPP